VEAVHLRPQYFIFMAGILQIRHEFCYARLSYAQARLWGAGLWGRSAYCRGQQSPCAEHVYTTKTRDKSIENAKTWRPATLPMLKQCSDMGGGGWSCDGTMLRYVAYVLFKCSSIWARPTLYLPTLLPIILEGSAQH